MAFRYTMVEFNKIEGTFDVYCYEDDDCIWEEKCETEEQAKAYGNRYLNGEFNDGFEVGVPA